MLLGSTQRRQTLLAAHLRSWHCEPAEKHMRLQIRAKCRAAHKTLWHDDCLCGALKAPGLEPTSCMPVTFWPGQLSRKFMMPAPCRAPGPPGSIRFIGSSPSSLSASMLS